MGAEIQIYHLYSNRRSGHYDLIVVDRPEFSNASEGSYAAACKVADDKLEAFIGDKPLKHIGSMEYDPIGEEIYAAKAGDTLPIFYCKNALNSHYLILGTAVGEEEFIAEALAEYGSEVDSSRVFHSEATVHLL